MTRRKKRTDEGGWIGVDLDGTLAEYHGWKGLYKIGEPVPAMVARVREWLAEGRDVRIFTARVGADQSTTAIMVSRMTIRHWCNKHLGKILPITAAKDFDLSEFWDDRAIGVIANTGARVG